jgi:hypothetical protein
VTQELRLRKYVCFESDIKVQCVWLQKILNANVQLSFC